MTRLLLLILALFGLATVAPAQDRAEWNRPVAPFRIAGNLYYVGTAGIASYLIADPAGHVLIDGAMRESADRIAANIRTLGFRIEDVRLLLQTHAHWDHVGGLAALKRASGARLLASAADRETLETGRTAYRDDVGTFPPVAVDGSIGDGEIVRLGGTAIAAHLTPGHTKGGTSYTLTVTERGSRLDVLIACSLTVANQRLVGDTLYPDAARDFETTFTRLGALRADIFLAGHAGSFGFEEKRARLAAGNALAFVDATELAAQLGRARAAFAEELARQRGAAR
jgi:metallo-beta-lactamase class B